MTNDRMSTSEPGCDEGEGTHERQDVPARHGDDVRSTQRAPAGAGADRPDHRAARGRPAAHPAYRRRVGAVQELPPGPPRLRGRDGVAGDAGGAGRRPERRPGTARRDGGGARRHRPRTGGRRRGTGRPRDRTRTAGRPGRRADRCGHGAPQVRRGRGAGADRRDADSRAVAALQRGPPQQHRGGRTPIPPVAARQRERADHGDHPRPHAGAAAQRLPGRGAQGVRGAGPLDREGRTGRHLTYPINGLERPMSVQEGSMSVDERIDTGAPSGVERKLGLALLVIKAAQLMLVLDNTIMNVALPSIQSALRLAPSDLNWVITAYALAFGGLLLVGGRAGDLFGRRRVFRIGLVVFTLASLLGGFAPSAATLIGARVVQGVGAAIAAPTALSLLATTFPAGAPRNKALGVYGAMGGLGSVVGLLLGGALTEYLSWRWVLFINAPIAVLVLIGTGVLVPGDTERGTLDVPGAIAATLGIGSVIFALTRGNTDGWNDAGTLASFAAGAVLLAAFVVIERYSRAPMVPPPVVRDRNRGGANAVMLLLGAGMLAMFYLLTLYMQVVRGYSAVHTGLA